MWIELVIQGLLALGAFASAFYARASHREQGRQNVALQKIADTYAAEVKGLKNQVAAIRKHAGKATKTEAEKIALQQQREARLQRKQEQENLKLMGKAFDWATNNL